MFQVKAAKEIKGSVTLPPCPDFMLLGGLAAFTSGKETLIGPASCSPVFTSIKEILSGILDVTAHGDGWKLSPKSGDCAPAVLLDIEALRFREFIVFMLAGTGKTVACRNLSRKRFDSWQRTAARAGCGLGINRLDDGTSCVTLTSGDTFAIPDDIPDADTLHAFMGLAAGLKRSISVSTDYQFSSPLRHLLPAIGYELSVKSLSESGKMDMLSRRLRALGGQKKSDQGLSFSVTADFNRVSDAPSVIRIPGDDILADVLILAKSLIQRGNLVIENMALETWASPMLALVRKMGCKPAIQDTEETSFGRTGMVQLQRFDLSGRKTDCSPLFQYTGHIPSIAVLACFCEGQSVIRGLTDLHNDEPDGLARIHGSVKAIGCRFGEMPDGIVIEGKKFLDGFDIPVNMPAPISGALVAAGLKSMGTSSIADDAILERWPEFKGLLDSVCEYRK